MRRSTSVLPILFSLVFFGCTYSKTTHQFSFYGSTQESYGRDFFYVAYGIKGSATATYYARGGGHMKDGLIADAKSHLIKSHPLGPNQSYTNMSIDIQTTESGVVDGQVASISKISLTATISADIIEFGQPPLNYSLPVRSVGKIEVTNSENSGFQDMREGQNSHVKSDRMRYYDSLSRGDEVNVVIDERTQSAVVLSKLSGDIKVELTVYDAGKKVWLTINDVVLPEAE